MRSLRISLFAAAFAALMALPAPAQMLTWQEVAPLNASRSEMRAVVIGGKIYVVGGFNPSGQQLNSLEVYDTATNAWTLRAPAPRGMDHHMMAAHGGKLYVLKYDSIYVYDPEANVWTSRSGAGMLARDDGTAVTIGDHIYVIGGGPLPIQRWAPGTGQWETRASLQTSRGHVNATVLDGKIWILGGRSGNAAFRTVEVYDPVANTVTSGPSMDSVRSGHAAEAVNGRIVVSGGEAPGSTWRLTTTTEILNPATGDWHFIPSPDTAVHGQASAALGGYFYVIGGATVAGSAINTRRVYRLNLVGDGGTGLPSPRSPGKRGAGAVWRQDGGKVVFEAEKGVFQANGRTLPLASPAARD